MIIPGKRRTKKSRIARESGFIQRLTRDLVFPVFCFLILFSGQIGKTQDYSSVSSDPKITEESYHQVNNGFPRSPEKIAFQTLPQNFEYNGVRSIIQDHKGFMWYGTADGLVRYDGINLYVYEHDPGDTTSLSNSTINSLAEDPNGNFWIGTARGLNLYNSSMDNFIHVGSMNENIARLNNNYITTLCVDRNSCLWVCTFGDGLNVYDHAKQQITHYSYAVNDSNTICSNRITSIVSDNENNVWIGSLDGLSFYSANENKFRHFFSEPGNSRSLSSNNITSLALDEQGTLWIGTRGGGLNKVIRQKNEFIIQQNLSHPGEGYLANNFLLSLCTDPAGYLWIGTENGGLNRLDFRTGHFDLFRVEEGNRHSLVSNSIWSLYYNREGKLWIGTATKGISVIDPKYSKFESFQKNIYDKTSISDNDVTGFTEDSQGNVWIATDGGGISKFNIENRQIVKTIYNSDGSYPLVNNAIQSVLYDKEDNLWVGTWAGGIDRLDKNGRKIRNYKLVSEDGAGDNNILMISADSKGTIWAGTSGSGLFRYDRTRDKFIQIASSNPTAVLNRSAYVSAIVEDQEESYLIGTLNGLVSLTLKKNEDPLCYDFAGPEQENGLSSRMIDVLFKDGHGRLWIGTSDFGMFLFNKNDSTFRSFTKQDGLPGNSIKGILEDESGYIWITTSRGLSRFNYDSLRFKNYNRDDGLNSNEFYVRSYLRTKNGLFFLGGENGFNIFSPEKISTNDFIPPVYLTNLKINNVTAEIGAKNSPLKKYIGETSEITLTYKQSSFTIEFVALNYTRSSRNQFMYKLEGFDEDWIDAGNNRSASYTNIKPGEYVFMVKGSNNDGIWNETPTALKISLKPPLWKTWWAILLYILVLSALVTISLMIWNERIHIKHQLKLEQLGREKEHELNEANIQFFTDISHEFRTPLSLIIAPLESLILSAQSKIKEPLLVIYRNAQRLLHLTNNLMDFRKLEEGKSRLKVRHSEIMGFIREVSSYFRVNFKRRDITFNIIADKEEIRGWFDPEKLETIVLNLLSNASKYTPDGGHIEIALAAITLSHAMKKYTFDEPAETSRQNLIEISVTDNGSGISPDDLPFIFDKFYQSGTSRKKKNTGTGIGLALVKGLIELNHGRIAARSNPDLETCISFFLPINRESFKEDEIVDESTSVLSRTIVDADEKVTSGQKKEEKETGEPNPKEEKAEVLIIEDNYELRTFLAEQLADSYSVLQAEDGKPGIELAFEHIPDIIVSDVVMPCCNGIEVCNILKADIRTCHIPIILLTAKTTIGDQIEGVDTGADAYITKPFNLQLLLAKINQLIQSRRKLYAHFSQDVYIMPHKLADNEMDQKFLQKATDYILMNIADNTLNVEGLANEMNLSRSNVYRKIKALTGKTIIEFIRIIRLKHALKLMETKKYSLAEIAYLTGFTSPSYFTKSFKDQYGKPPSEYMD